MHPLVPLAREKKAARTAEDKEGKGVQASTNAMLVILRRYGIYFRRLTVLVIDTSGTVLMSFSFNGGKEAVAARGHVVIVGLH